MWIIRRRKGIGVRFTRPTSMNEAVSLQLLLIDESFETDRALEGSNAEMRLAMYREGPFQLEPSSALVAHMSFLFYKNSIFTCPQALDYLAVPKL